MCFVTAPFFEPVALSASLCERGEGLAICAAAFATWSSSRVESWRSSRIADVADELADLLRVLGRDLLRDVVEQAADELAGLLERRQALLLGPGGEAAGPELVVLVEVPLLALREVLAAAREPLLERGELLVAVDVDALGLGPTLSSRSARSAPRFSSSTCVTIEAAK